MRKKVITVIITLGIVFTLLCGALIWHLISNNDEKSIDNKNDLLVITRECVEVEFYGPNGGGVAEVRINETELTNLFANKINPQYEYGYEWLDTANRLCNETTISINKTNELSNDDLITITFNIPEDFYEKYNLDIENEINMTVSGLPDRMGVNPFDSLYFVFDENGNPESLLCNTEGFNGYYCEYLFDFYDENGDAIEFKDIKQGDTIIVVLNQEVEKAAYKEGYVTEKSRDTILVEDNELVLVTSTSQISQDLLNVLEEETTRLLINMYKPYSGLSVKETYLVSTWFKYDGNEPYSNEILRIFEIIFDYKGVEKKIYMKIETNGLYISNKGFPVIMGVRNEAGNGQIMIDPETVLQVPGYKLSDIEDKLTGYVEYK